MATQPRVPGAASSEVDFELERFERTQPDRVEIAGRWFGLRGRRFVRPVLNLHVEGGPRRRLVALLEHKPWAPDDGQPWIAAFTWPEGAGTVARAELEVGPGLVLELPAPGGGVIGTRVRALRPPPLPPPPDLGAIERNATERAEAVAARDMAERDTVEKSRAAAARDLADRLIAERDAAEQARFDALSVRDAAVTQRDAAVRDRDRAITERDEARNERDRLQAELDRVAHERDIALAERNRTLRDGEAVVRDRDQAAAERDGARAELARAVPARETALRERDAEAMRADRAESERDTAIAERKSAIGQRDRARRERDRAMRAAGLQPSDELDAVISVPPSRSSRPPGGDDVRRVPARSGGDDVRQVPARSSGEAGGGAVRPAAARAAGEAGGGAVRPAAARAAGEAGGDDAGSVAARGAGDEDARQVESPRPARSGTGVPSRPVKRIGVPSDAGQGEPKRVLTPVIPPRRGKLSRGRPRSAPSAGARWAVRALVVLLLIASLVVLAILLGSIL
jgi:hypothetical protein